MNYYKKVKSAFDDWATTYESDVVPKLDLRGYSYDELAKTILSYYDKSMDKKSILELGVGTGVLGERVKSLVPSTEIDGLYISSEMLKRSKEKGVRIGFVTLHVGLGTFRPVKAEKIEEHEMHSEFCIVPQETADIINETKKNGGRVIVVGTTSCRTLESFAKADGTMEQAPGGQIFSSIRLYVQMH